MSAIPHPCRRAVDLGCGNGELTRLLFRRGVPDVVGVDSDAECIRRCEAHPDAGDIHYVHGGMLDHSLPPGSADLVCAVASLHHVDARRGLLAMRQLVAPGGVLVVVGLAKPDFPHDIPVEAAAQVVRLVTKRPPARTSDTPSPPLVWPPPERYSTMQQLASELLPGVRWRRHLMWRYSLVWFNRGTPLQAHASTPPHSSS